jgi:hypothetical protein
VGSSIKLPNTEDTYRLYQDDQVIINACVHRATPAIQREIDALPVPIGQIVCGNAHFFSHVYIARLGPVRDCLTIDLEKRTVTKPAIDTTFSVGTPFVDTSVIAYDQGNSTSSVSIPIRWGGDMCLHVTFSRNPQIRNGLRLQGTNVPQGSGLLTRNYRPRLFRLNHLYSSKPVLVNQNLVRTTSKRGMSGPREFTMRIGVR